MTDQKRFLDTVAHWGKNASAYDIAVFMYLMLGGIVLTVMVWHLGLYADDYWNLHDATTRSLGGFLRHHLSHTNSRYSYAVLHRLLVALFYDPANPFGSTYIRAAHLIGVWMHVVNCALTYRVLKELGVNPFICIAILPLIVFPVFGPQAIFWIAAYMAHVLGLLCFLVAALATLKHRPIPIFAGILIGLGASEFVLLPSLFLVAMFAKDEWMRHDKVPQKERIIRVLTRTAPLLLPFLAYALLVITSSGVHRRLNILRNHPQFWDMPIACLARFFGHYIPKLQPVALLGKYPWAMILILTLLMAASTSRKQAVQTTIFVIFFIVCVFPLAAVGYYTGGSRLRYTMGFFFYAAAAQAVSAVIERWKGPAGKYMWVGLTAIFVTGISAYHVREFRQFSQDGISAYACVKEITHHLLKETGNKPPKQIEMCDYPKKVGEFQVINQWSLPRLLALEYGTTMPTKVRLMPACSENQKARYTPQTEGCSVPFRYSIH